MSGSSGRAAEPAATTPWRSSAAIPPHPLMREGRGEGESGEAPAHLTVSPKVPHRARRPTRPPGPDRGRTGQSGSEYARTRHNLGFRCIDRIASEYSISLLRRHRTALIGEGTVEGLPIALAKPRTYVNRSGQAVAYLLARYRAPPARLLVIFDDIALPWARSGCGPMGAPAATTGPGPSLRP